MEKFIINRTERLFGKVAVQGAKNSALPILTATLLCDSACRINNCPNLTDIKATLEILESLGAKVEKTKDFATIDASDANGYKISKAMMSRMRSSILFLGAISSRVGKVELCFPGGCELGPRPINLHLEALTKMGLQLECIDGVLTGQVAGRLSGAEIDLTLPSVGATENIILAAVLAKGTTVVNNAAREPEIIDLCNFLMKCGARINGAGGSRIEIEGVDRLQGNEHDVIPDRIVATTYMVATAAVDGDVIIDKLDSRHLQGIIDVLRKSGCRVIVGPDFVRVVSDGKLNALGEVVTEPYPGFPTDAQALFMVLAAVAHGQTTFVENLFENRYKHAVELIKMGAKIELSGKTAVVRGVDTLLGSDLQAKDLRSAAALTIAGLLAKGETTVGGLEHLDRGYENFERNLKKLGAEIRRV